MSREPQVVDDVSWTLQGRGTGRTLLGRAQLLPQASSCAGVLILHGYGDHLGRYDAVAEAFLAASISVFRYDALGHGRSPGQRGFVSRFHDYVQDAADAYAAARQRLGDGPLSVLGHSTGGLVCLRAVQQEQLPGLHRLVLTSPLLRLAREQRKVSDCVASCLSALLPRLSLSSAIRPEQLTRDCEWQRRTAADSLCHRCVTPRWYWETTLAGRQALLEAERLSVPTLIAFAAADELVDAPSIQQFANSVRASSRLILRPQPGARHEVLNELEREPLVEEIVRFCSETSD